MLLLQRFYGTIPQFPLMFMTLVVSTVKAGKSEYGIHAEQFQSKIDSGDPCRFEICLGISSFL